MGSLAIACPGQGAQHPQMFALALESPAACEWLAQYSAALGLDVVRLAQEGKGLFSNRHAQILICGAAVATWTALRERLAAPELFLGYSVGELAAYGCAGLWDVAGFAGLVERRIAWMDQAAPPGSGMMAVKGITVASMRQFCQDHRVAVAIVNGDDHLVLGGLRGDLALAADAISAAGHWCKTLDVSVPSHTSAMAAAAKGFRDDLTRVAQNANAGTVLAGIDGRPTAGARIVDSLAAQIAQTIDWQACMRGARERDIGVVLELGPGSGLSRMFQEAGGEAECRSVDDFRSLDGIVKWVNARVARQHW
jgi:[acyl-carrier-protein] S-malonyltransferase